MIYISWGFANQQQLRKKSGWWTGSTAGPRHQALAILASLARNNKKWVQTKLIIQAFDHFFTGLLCYCCWARNYAQIFFVPCVRQQKFPFSFLCRLSKHCCMKCPQILREKTSSQKSTGIALRIRWYLPAEGKYPHILMESTCRR